MFDEYGQPIDQQRQQPQPTFAGFVPGLSGLMPSMDLSSTGFPSNQALGVAPQGLSGLPGFKPSLLQSAQIQQALQAGSSQVPLPKPLQPADNRNSLRVPDNSVLEEKARQNAEKLKQEQQVKSEEQRKKEREAVPKCHLHKKPNAKCKFCTRHSEALKELDAKNEQHVEKSTPSSGSRARGLGQDPSQPLELINKPTYGFSPLLLSHIQDSAHLKQLNTMQTFDQVVEECFEYAQSVHPYLPNSQTLPSPLFCCLLRFMSLNLTGLQLKSLIENRDSPFIRCCGFLFIRQALPHDQLWEWLQDHLLDDDEFIPVPEEEPTTIGEFVENLLLQERYLDCTMLPRLPGGIKRNIEDKLAATEQCRRRNDANKRLLDVYRRENVKVEVQSHGDWLRARTLELLDEVPSRILVRVKMEDEREENIHLGRVILLEDPDRAGRRRRQSSRSRSPVRFTPSDPNDLSYSRGRSDAELINELRAAQRDKAVTSGKDYSRKPIGFKKACALAREQGKASTKLMEEETFVREAKRSGERLPEIMSRDEMSRQNQQSDEHKKRMQALFEKYGNQKAASSKGHDDVEGPDRMRLG